VAHLPDPASPPQGEGMQFTTPLQHAGMQISGCRSDNALLKGMGYSLICLKSPDPSKVTKKAGRIKLQEIGKIRCVCIFFSNTICKFLRDTEETVSPLVKVSPFTTFQKKN
jgi:hypothetical protein